MLYSWFLFAQGGIEMPLEPNRCLNRTYASKKSCLYYAIYGNRDPTNRQCLENLDTFLSDGHTLPPNIHSRHGYHA